MSTRVQAVELSTEGPRPVVPVKWWAGLGVAFIAFQLYLYGAWLLDGPTRTDPGPIDQPGYTDVAVAFMNVGMPIGALFVLYRYVWRPLRRDGRLGFDGRFVLALACVAWQDPIVNYTQVTATYNANFWNFGSWGEHIPGWMSPRGAYAAEPITGFIPAYVFTAFMIVLLTDRVLRATRRRRPQTGTPGLILVAFVLNLVVGLVSEAIALRAGMYAFGGAIREISLFSGTHYQLPLNEAVLNAVLLGGFALVYHFRDGRGHSIVERGIDRVPEERRRPWLRWLALVAAVNSIFLVYNVGWTWFALHQDPWPQDLIERSYLMDELCGPGTGMACPGPDVPIPHGDSDYVDEDGDFQSGPAPG